MKLTKTVLQKMIQDELKLVLENRNHLHSKTVGLVANELQYTRLVEKVAAKTLVDGLEFGDPTVTEQAKNLLATHEQALKKRKNEKLQYMLTLIAHNRGDEIR